MFLSLLERKLYLLRSGLDGSMFHQEQLSVLLMVTDENNFVVDLHLERIDHPQELAEDLINTVGVVEHGLFLNMVDKVIVGDPNARA